MNTQPHRSNQSDDNFKSVEAPGAKVAILLCTYNGSRFLADQLESFVRQTHKNWIIYASDDGSTDDTLAILNDYQQLLGKERLILLNGPRQGFAKNFLSLIKNSSITADFFAFSDQDDIWFEDKLERSVANVPSSQNTPSLYCSRTRLVTAEKMVLGYSPLFSAKPAFANALVQSIAGANTMLINRAARELLAKTPENAAIVAHDWLTYLIVSGCNGTVLYDPDPTLDYRQHNENLIGANTGMRDQFVRLAKMCTGRYREWNTNNLQILNTFESKLTPQNQRTMAQFSQARRSTFFPRLYLIKKSGIFRQTLRGNISLFIAACLNKI